MKNEGRGVYVPLMDWWVATILVGYIVLLVIAIPLVVWRHLPLLYTAGGVLCIIFAILYLVDNTFYTYYLLEKEQLVVHRSFRKWVFPYRNMKTIRNGNVLGLFSFGGRKRFSLSADCFSILLTTGDWKSISVSPRDKEPFLKELLAGIENERSNRATYSKQRVGHQEA